jgi:hypothetical protein
MHLSFGLGGVPAFWRILMNCQGIHVCTQANDTSAIPDAQVGHKAGTANATVDLHSHAAEEFRNKVRSPQLFETGLRVTVEVMAPRLEKVEKFDVSVHANPWGIGGFARILRAARCKSWAFSHPETKRCCIEGPKIP